MSLEAAAQNKLKSVLHGPTDIRKAPPGSVLVKKCFYGSGYPYGWFHPWVYKTLYRFTRHLRGGHTFVRIACKIKCQTPTEINIVYVYTLCRSKCPSGRGSGSPPACPSPLSFLRYCLALMGRSIILRYQTVD